jgi:hypothetical protein
MSKKPYQSPGMEIWLTKPIHLLTVSHLEPEDVTEEIIDMDYEGDGTDEDGEGSTFDTF